MSEKGDLCSEATLCVHARLGRCTRKLEATWTRGMVQVKESPEDEHSSGERQRERLNRQASSEEGHADLQHLLIEPADVLEVI